MPKVKQIDRFFISDHKYKFEYDKYLLPVLDLNLNLENEFSKQNFHSVLSHLVIDEETPGDVNKKSQFLLEPFTKTITPIKPSICYTSFMTEEEINEVKEATNSSTLQNIFEEKLRTFCINGIPKVLVVELLISVVRFSNKNLYDIKQTGALLAIFYNTHLYYSYNLFASIDDIYLFFQEYLFYHTFSIPPERIKLFSADQAKQVAQYFCTVYLKNVPIIGLLAFPNYALLLKIKNPPKEDILLMHKSKGKGKEKEKKDKKKKKK